MTEEKTAPYARLLVAVGTLRADVVKGPDVGLASSATGETLSIGTATSNGLVLTDRTVSRFHVEVTRSAEGLGVLDHGSTNGTFVGDVRIGRAIVAPGTVLRLGSSHVRLGDGAPGTVEVAAGDRLAGLVGRSPAIRRLMSQIERAAATAVGVLIVGESGTGKELAARALHDLGARAAGPFVVVDCGVLPATLVASELFGHERGAFTGADRQHVGAFERADGGTIFLDEIGELPTPLQPALLGVLERRVMHRVGGRVDIPIDVRVLSATHRDLRAEVNAGRFRLDLYYRLAAVRLEMPPLREHAEDVPLLVEHFARAEGYGGPIQELFSDAAMRALSQHRWAGNVRELRNVVQATLAMGAAPILDGLAEATPTMTPAGTSAANDPTVASTDPGLLERPYGEARGRVLADFEQRYLERLLERTGGNVSRAAREAIVDRSYLRDLLRKHGLRPGR